MSSLVAGRELMREFLEGPMPTPSLDAYIALSQWISSQVDDDVRESVVSQSEYLRLFGNLTIPRRSALRPQHRRRRVS